MPHRPTRVAALGVGAVLALSLTACGGAGSAGGGGQKQADCTPAHQITTVTPGTLTVAFYDLPPFSLAKGNDLTGVDGDLLKKFAAKECLTLKPMPMAAAAVIPTVQSGRADVAAAAWYRTKARSEIVALPDPIYLDQQAFISADGVASYSQLKGRKVGTVDGDMWVEDARKLLGGDLKVYNSTVNMNQDLKAGRIDVAIDSYGSGVYNNPDKKVVVVQPDPAVAGTAEAAQVTLPVPKNNPQLLEAMNAFIAEAKKNGEIAPILEQNKLQKTAADTGEPRLL